MLNPSNVVYHVHSCPDEANLKQLLDRGDAILRYRGALAVLALVSVIIITVEAEETESLNLQAGILTATSFVGAIIVTLMYCVRVQIEGTTSSQRYRCTIWMRRFLASRHFGSWAVEAGIWMVHMPPYTKDVWENAYLLNFGIILRLYTIFTFLGHAVIKRNGFAQVVSIFAGVPLDGRFLFRLLVVKYPLRVPLLLFILTTTSYALLFSQIEGHSLLDSMYFIIVTMGTIGYGDVVPHSVRGKVLVFVTWGTSCVVVGWVVLRVHDFLSLTQQERALSDSILLNQLSNDVRQCAAVTIQRFFQCFCCAPRVAEELVTMRKTEATELLLLPHNVGKHAAARGHREDQTLLVATQRLKLSRAKLKSFLVSVSCHRRDTPALEVRLEQVEAKLDEILCLLKKNAPVER